MYSLNVYSLKLIKNDKGEFDLAIDYSEKRNIWFIKNNEKRINTSNIKIKPTVFKHERDTVIYDFLWALFHPLYWNMLYEYSPELDEKLNELIYDKSKVSNFDEYTVDIGGYTIWIANYPYASCMMYNRNDDSKLLLRPKRRTIKKVWQYVQGNGRPEYIRSRIENCKNKQK